MRLFAMSALVLLGACSDGPSEEERQADVAEVEANQQPPAEEFEPDPIRYREIEKYDLFGAGCSFAPDSGGLGAVAIAMADEGYIIRDGDLLRFAADVGSRELPYLARNKYTGLEYSFILDLEEEGGEQSGYETTDYRGSLVVRDASDRVVYEADGLVQCGA